ncbi:hypothetical protein OWV82_021613 [Melia azedarach]|uniref:Uncharacterized protein n=1 Tax=Melia azedarach TaxID=155640 RepID=A0ACC1WZX7_MELAZ|nr:hypothetical protein OWV82_021613 [Melia azedarach]
MLKPASTADSSPICEENQVLPIPKRFGNSGTLVDSSLFMDQQLHRLSMSAPAHMKIKLDGAGVNWMDIWLRDRGRCHRLCDQEGCLSWNCAYQPYWSTSSGSPLGHWLCLSNHLQSYTATDPFGGWCVPQLLETFLSFRQRAYGKKKEDVYVWSVPIIISVSSL